MATKLSELLSLRGKTALITGGSRGLGYQIADALAEWGATPILVARDASALGRAAEQLKATHGCEVDTIAADCANEADIARLAQQAVTRHGHVDVLVNNAGMAFAAPAEEYPLEAWDRLMNVNVRGAFLLSQAIGKLSMIPRRAGRIINVASVGGLRGNAPGKQKTIAYNSSKAALINLTRALAGEWGMYGITVNAIAPGFFPSQMTHKLLELKGNDLVKQIPLQRFGDEDDLKGTALLFASAAGKHITGQVLAVDGGATAV